MASKPRMVKDEGTYHFIARGNNKKRILEVTNGYKRFKEILLVSKIRFDWRIHHYCLMPNHLHILAYVQNGSDVSRLMKFMLQSYSQWYRGKFEYTGYLWQGRFKSPLIDNDSYLLACGRYIERNPVRAKLCARMEDHPWSSYPYYALGAPDPLITESPGYGEFGFTPQERQKSYRDFAKIDAVPEALLGHLKLIDDL